MTGAVPRGLAAAVRDELKKRRDRKSKRMRPVDGATAEQRGRASELLKRGRERFEANNKPNWWRPGLHVTYLDLLTDDELEELGVTVNEWFARAGALGRA